MKIIFTKEEKEQHFFNAMCNGLNSINYWKFEIDYKQSDYKSAKKMLLCRGSSRPYDEEIFMEMLRMGKSIEFVDKGCEGKYTRSLTLDMIYKNFRTIPIRNLFRIIKEDDDAEDADIVLQSVLFKDIIFG